MINLSSDQRKISDYSFKNPCDWKFYFELDQKITFDELIGNDEIEFLIEEKYVKGFIISIKNMDNFNANYKINDKAKILTNLLSVISGKFVSAELVRIKAITDVGEITSKVMSLDNPLLSTQKIILDLKKQNIQKFFFDEQIQNIIHHLTNAIFNSYKNPESAIKELVLAYGDVKNLPPKFKKYGGLRHALSHPKIRWNTTNLQTAIPFLKFDNTNALEKNYLNKQVLTRENFYFLHSALDEFRDKYDLTTEKINE